LCTFEGGEEESTQKEQPTEHPENEGSVAGIDWFAMLQGWEIRVSKYAKRVSKYAKCAIFWKNSWRF
jgi:hypothetical protein